jgi:excisionase family DNA binding protein
MEDRLLTPSEVASLFRVDPKTVTRWAAAGRISSIRTPGGHRRYRESEIRRLLESDPQDGLIPRPLRSGDRSAPTLPIGRVSQPG